MTLSSPHVTIWGHSRTLGFFLFYSLLLSLLPTHSPICWPCYCHKRLGKNSRGPEYSGRSRWRKGGNVVEGSGEPQGTRDGAGVKRGICGLSWEVTVGWGTHLQVPVYNVLLVTVVHSRYNLGVREGKEDQFLVAPKPLSLPPRPCKPTHNPAPGPQASHRHRPRHWGLTPQLGHSRKCCATCTGKHLHSVTQILGCPPNRDIRTRHKD